MNYPFHYARFIFIPVALVGSLFASPVLGQEATSTENGSSTQTVETIPPVDAASNEALSIHRQLIMLPQDNHLLRRSRTLHRRPG